MDDDEEPMLKYERMKGQIPEVLRVDSATCLDATDRLLVLGTTNGQVHVLGIEGHEIKLYRPHTDRVTGVAINRSNTCVASCSQDGTVVIVDIWEQHKECFKFKKPIRCISLHPSYPDPDTKLFVCSVEGSNLSVCSHNYFGLWKTVIPGGDGPIFKVSWSSSSLLAWACADGVKIYDHKNEVPVASVARPRGSEPPHVNRCFLEWHSPTILIIGWGNFVQIVEMRTSKDKSKLAKSTPVVVSAQGRHLQTIGKFLLDGYVIAGIAPFKSHLIILAIPTVAAEDDPEEELHPELLVVTHAGEVLSYDALPIDGFEECTPADYCLTYSDPNHSLSSSSNVETSGDALYFVMSPKDIIVAKLQDADDHISYLLQKRDYRTAYDTAVKFEVELRKYKLRDIVELYLRHLLHEKHDFKEAAKLCPKLFGKDIVLWNTWVRVFSNLGEAIHLARLVPLGDPQLDPDSYGMILSEFLVSDPTSLLKLLREWPPDIYDSKVIISAVQSEYLQSKSSVLLRVLAELYVRDGSYVEALDQYIRLGEADIVFDMIDREPSIMDSLVPRVLQLMTLDPTRASKLLVAAIGNGGDVEKVVNMLESEEHLAFLFLDELFKHDANLGAQFHELQVSLYARFCPSGLMSFLQASSHYVLENALSVCKQYAMIPEQVFLLGRMGDTHQALFLIIDEMRDVEMAIRFVEEHRDSDLWEALVERCLLVDKTLNTPLFISGLLDHVTECASVDPLALIDQIPLDLPIPNLNLKLQKIVFDYSLEERLRQDTKRILEGDCVELMMKFHSHLKAGHAVDASKECHVCCLPLMVPDDCSDIIVFMCGHQIHKHCGATHVCMICSSSQSTSTKVF